MEREKRPGVATQPNLLAFQNLEGWLPISPPVEPDSSPHLPATTCRNTALQLEANMGEVIRFISKAERERIRLIREARAIYDDVFPPSDFVDEQRDKTLVAPALATANTIVHKPSEVASPGRPSRGIQ
jgi:hypothetical protein